MAAEIDQILAKYTSTSKEDGYLHSIAFVVRGKEGAYSLPWSFLALHMGTEGYEQTKFFIQVQQES
jgi:hypothetical protein